jgi:8-oxo-dGTP diphosphatase
MKRYTHRIYGFLQRPTGEVLVALERFKDRPLIKYPGGGLEWGESHAECLIREFQEELSLDIRLGDCVFFNDFPVISAFDTDVYVQAFFYRVEAVNEAAVEAIATVDTWEVPAENGEQFKWVRPEDLDPARFTYAIEQVATRAWLAEARSQR